VWDGYAASVRDRLWEANTAKNRFQILEEALLLKARHGFDRHPAVRYALDVFDRSNGARAVSDVVQRIGISSRRFWEVFRGRARSALRVELADVIPAWHSLTQKLLSLVGRPSDAAMAAHDGEQRVRAPLS
jgi:hypothetical protein